MTPHQSWFVPDTYKVLLTQVKIYLGDNLVVNGIGIGTIQFQRKTQDGLTHKFHIPNVIHAPALSMALISVRKLTRGNNKLIFDGDTCCIQNKSSKAIVADAQLCHGLYHLLAHPFIFANAEFAKVAIDINVLHRRMGHIGHSSIRQMVLKGQLHGIDSVTGSETYCEPCIQGKMKLPFNRDDKWTASRPLELIHSDVGGPIELTTCNEYHFWITFIDDHTRYPWILFLKRKSDAFSTFQTWKKHVEAFMGTTISELRFSDNWI